MKRLFLIPYSLFLLALSAQAQQHVQAELDEVLRHSEWVTQSNQTERSDPKTGVLLKRNIEYRLSLPADGGVVERMTAAFEADCELAYTYVRTSAEYNQQVAIRRPVEMRLQNDVRLEAGSTEYSYLLLNVLNPDDTRFRTTTIFLWRPESEGRIDARVYILYGVRPTAITSSQTVWHTPTPRSEAIEKTIAAIASNRGRTGGGLSARREIMERDPDTGTLTTYTRSMSLSPSQARLFAEAFKRDQPRAYTSSVSTRSGGDTIYRATVVQDTLRMAYVLTMGKKLGDLQAVFGPLSYSERRSDLVADEKANYVIVNKGSRLYLGIDPQTGHAVTADQPQAVRFRRQGDHYSVILNGRALTDTRTKQVGGNYVLTWEPIEANDLRQRWIIVRHGEHYNLVNVATKQTANLAGGAKEAGSPIVSYTTNHRNATSNNRLWEVKEVKGSYVSSGHGS